MMQNDQIEGLSFRELRELLGYKPFMQFEAENPGSGRTTKVLLKALEEISKGRKVAILCEDEDEARHLTAEISKMIEKIRKKTGRKLYNLVRGALSRGMVDQNETVLVHHTFQEKKA